MRSFSVIGIALLLPVQLAIAASPSDSAASRGEPELRVCTQNLHDYGRDFGRSSSRFGKAVTKKKIPRDKTEQLIKRMREARCDVIAVQEVGGDTYRKASANLDKLAVALSRAVGRHFRGIVGDVNEGEIRNGVLVAEDRAEVLGTFSPRDLNLPKLQPLGPARKFIRPPLIVRLRVTRRNNSAVQQTQELSLISIHQKSKVESWKDLSQTQFEISRMEAAEAIRDLALKEAAANKLVIVLGDFNSRPESASLQILEGRRSLEDFRSRNGCRVDKALEPVCLLSTLKPQEPRAAQLVGLFSARYPEGSGEGSYRYKGRAELIDEIMVPAKDAWMYRSQEGTETIGFVGDFFVGSDHKLLWAELNW